MGGAETTTEAVIAMAEKATIRIQLTREQELQLAAAIGLLVGTLELDLADLQEGDVASALIPEALMDPATPSLFPLDESSRSKSATGK